MYVGGDEHGRARQLRELETLLYGYSLAVEQHDLDEPGRGFVKAFGAYLEKRFGWPTTLGPVVAILDGIQPHEDPWERFWELIDEFKNELGSA